RSLQYCLEAAEHELHVSNRIVADDQQAVADFLSIDDCGLERAVLLLDVCKYAIGTGPHPRREGAVRLHANVSVVLVVARITDQRDARVPRPVRFVTIFDDDPAGEWRPSREHDDEVVD